ncbi:MAG: ATP-binding cassette domain-containing protein [Lachnospiraceae bacterium]|nr:ATP-binding cassette domain-containing protein [Lachnospiraceae bacterium]
MSLSVSNLSKKYGEKTALEDLSFEMEKPGVYALLGTNGAGKTTAIRMMLNMLSRDSGEVLWNGKALDTAACNVGYLAEERGLYPKYALMDQLIYFAGLRGVSRADAKKRIAYWAKRLEVEEYLYPGKVQPEQSQQNLYGSDEKTGAAKEERTGAAGHERTGAAGHEKTGNAKHERKAVGRKRRKKAAKPLRADQLSKGNQQKIQFMMALISDPELIILDEPMSGLDPVNTDLFRSIIHEEIEKGKYLIMSSHQMATVEEFCTDIIILNRSKTILQGNLNEIKKSFGRIHLSIKVEQNIDSYIEKAGAELISEKEGEYELKVSGEAQANQLLGMLITDGIVVIRFDLREPSLHEIFVKKVGEANEV